MAFKEVPNRGGSHKANRKPDAPVVREVDVPFLPKGKDGELPKTKVPLTNLFTNPNGRGKEQGGGTSDRALRKAKKDVLKKGRRKKGK